MNNEEILSRILEEVLSKIDEVHTWHYEKIRDGQRWCLILKGGEENEDQKAQTNQEERYQAEHVVICRGYKRVDKTAVLRR